MSIADSSVQRLFLNVLIFMFLINSSQCRTLFNSHMRNQTINKMVTEVCNGYTSCFNRVQSEVEKIGGNKSVPDSILPAALTITIRAANSIIRMLSNFISLSPPSTHRVQLAVQDCKELLDFSISEIKWSLEEMKKIRSGSGSIQSIANLKAWLSAAVGNQDTCLEGFDGTNLWLQKIIRQRLSQVTHVLSNVLALYTELHTKPSNPNKETDFTDWIEESTKPRGTRINAIVAANGRGSHRNITTAIQEAPNYSARRYVIYVKEGVYEENIDLKKKKTNIMLVGDGMGRTIISGNRNFLQGWTTFRTATVAVSGKGFIAKDMTFRNTAGAASFQAVALRVDSDESAFFRCSIEGYQDSLYSHSLRQFFRECNIYGTVDFIFGNGAAVLQNCNIIIRKPLPLQKVTITAQGRRSPYQTTGFSLQDCRVYANQPTYLGRPWKEFSRTVFINTYLPTTVPPKGWLEWAGDFALRTLYYGEYKNYGPGAATSGRVIWPGYHVIRDPSVASLFTVEQFIRGLSWLPSTGIRFSAGLSN